MSSSQDVPTQNDNEFTKEETKSPAEKTEMKSPEPETKITMSPEKEEAKTPETVKMNLKKDEVKSTAEKAEMPATENKTKKMMFPEKEETSPEKEEMFPEKEEMSPEKEEMSPEKEEMYPEKRGIESADEKKAIIPPEKDTMKSSENEMKEILSPEKKEEMKSPETQTTKQEKSPENEKVRVTSGRKKEIEALEMKERNEDIEILFDFYACFEDKHGVEGITLKNTEKWFEQAGIFSDKMENKVTKSDVAKSFAQIAKERKRLNLTEFKFVVQTLALEKMVKEHELMRMLTDAGRPESSGMFDFLSTAFKPCC